MHTAERKLTGTARATVIRTKGRETDGGRRTGRKRGAKPSRRSYLLLVVGFLAIILVVQMLSLYHKQRTLEAREAALQKQVEEQQEKSEDLKKYEEYTKSDEYTENMARSRAGLVKPNEIIFREKK